MCRRRRRQCDSGDDSGWALTTTLVRVLRNNKNQFEELLSLKCATSSGEMDETMTKKNLQRGMQVGNSRSRKVYTLQKGQTKSCKMTTLDKDHYSRSLSRTNRQIFCVNKFEQNDSLFVTN